MRERRCNPTFAFEAAPIRLVRGQFRRGELQRDDGAVVSHGAVDRSHGAPAELLYEDVVPEPPPDLRLFHVTTIERARGLC